MNPSPIISALHLHEILKCEKVIMLDATIAPVGSGQQIASEFIPGSILFDFDHEVCDQNSDLPHMLPSPEQFAEQAAALGISNSSTLVVYDRVGMFASPRAWWMFRIMQHEHVQVLDGGLPAWKSAGFEVNDFLDEPKGRGNYSASLRSNMLVDLHHVNEALSNVSMHVLDARSAARFYGKEPEPRPNLRCGHMPGAFNLPYTQVLHEGKMKSKRELVELFSSYEGKRLLFSCGSGVTACILALASEIAGFRDWAVYDGSWAEWGRADANLPVISE